MEELFWCRNMNISSESNLVWPFMFLKIFRWNHFLDILTAALVTRDLLRVLRDFVLFTFACFAIGVVDGAEGAELH